MSYIQIENITKSYKTSNIVVSAINDISFNVNKGDYISITGKSGCGKTTLLNLIAGLDKPDSGNIIFNKTNISTLSIKKLSEFRLKNIGIIFQFFNLIPILTVEENICLPLILKKEKIDPILIQKALNDLGLKSKKNMLPSSLSGGEQQRVAIGRAIISKPSLLLADEPTGNLDSHNTEIVMDLITYLNKEYGQTIILVTHDRNVSQRCNKNITIEDGKIIDITGDKYEN